MKRKSYNTFEKNLISALENKGNFFIFNRDWAVHHAPDLTASTKWLGAKAYPTLKTFNARLLTPNKFSKELTGEGTKHLSEAESFLMLCGFLDDRKKGLIIINDAKHLPNHTQRILARLGRRIRQHHLDWKIILFDGNDLPSKEKPPLNPIYPLDQYYPTDKDAAVWQQYLTDNKSGAVKSNFLWYLLPLVILAALLFLIFTIEIEPLHHEEPIQEVSKAPAVSTVIPLAVLDTKAQNARAVTNFTSLGFIAEEVPEGIRVYHPPTIYFSGSEKEDIALSPEAARCLSDIANELKQDYLKDRAIRTEGHSNSVGSELENMIVSEKRAKVAASGLLFRGISAQRITSIWFGEYRPRFEEKNPDGSLNKTNQDFNRRVEFTILNP